MVNFSTTLITITILCSTYSYANNEDVSQETDIKIRSTSERKPHVRSLDINASKMREFPVDPWKPLRKHPSKIDKKIKPLLRNLADSTREQDIPEVRRLIFLSQSIGRLMKRIVANEGIVDRNSVDYKKAEGFVKRAVDGIDIKDTNSLVAAANMLYKKMSVQKLKIFMIISNGVSLFNG
ncbi:uncharacterized protein LOC142984221 [Anticarsia gemmatalis]|uniref:uncharacterized protein LOC142984221 n=1 Tax=Anticarsia gemmatalis TaxID=129554 RepID=UPI003F76E097